MRKIILPVVVFMIGNCVFAQNNVGIGTSTPGSNLQVSGSFAAAWATQTGTSYNVASTDHFILFSGTASTVFTLPQALAVGSGNFKGREYVIKNGTTAYTVTINAYAGESIDGGSITLAAGNTVTLISNGNTSGSTWNVVSTTPASGSATGWSTTGNAGTTPSSAAIGSTVNNNFMGTTDAKDLVIASNDLERMRIASGGNVGISNSSPNAKLDINGSQMINGGLTNTSARPAVGSGTLANGELRGYSSSGPGADDGFLRLSAGAGTTAGVKSYIDLSGYNASGSTNDMYENIVLGTSGTERMRILYNGNVGIGATAPASVLSVGGNGNALYEGYFNQASTTGGATGVYGAATGTSGAVYGVQGTTPSTTANATGVYGSATGTSGAVFGVEGTTPSTTANAAAVYGSETGTTGATYGVYGSDASSTGYGVYGTATTAGGTGTYGKGTANGTFAGTAGVYGTETPVASDYAAGVIGSANNTGAYLNSGQAYGIYGVGGGTTPGYNYGVYGQLGGSTTGTSSNYYGAGLYGANYNRGVISVPGLFAGYFNGNVGIGNPSSSSDTLRFYNGSNANVVGIQSAATSTSYVMQLPTAQGAAGTVLTNNGSGGLSWTGGSGTGASGYWTRSGTQLYNTNLTDNVGIGTSSPNNTLEIQSSIANGTEGDVLRLSSVNGATGNGAGILWTNNSENNQMARIAGLDNGNWGGNLEFYTTAGTGSSPGGPPTPKMTILGNGDVGIGTTGPGTILDIVSGSNWNLSGSNGDIRLGASPYYLKAGIATSGSGAGDVYVGATGTGTSRIFLGSVSSGGTNYTQTLSIQNGVVGIGSSSGNNTPLTGNLSFYNSGNANAVSIVPGATSASYTLTLPTAQGAAGTVLTNNGSGTLTWVGGTGGSGSSGYWTRTSSTGPLYNTNLTDNVGIGTNSPASQLTVVSSGNGTGAYFTVLPQNLTQSVNISYNHIFEAGSNGTNSLYLDAQSSGNIYMQDNGGTGNVGIGSVTTAAAKLNLYSGQTANTSYNDLNIEGGWNSNESHYINWVDVAAGNIASIWANINSSIVGSLNFGNLFYGSYRTSEPLMTILATSATTANVGIGTTSPGNKLDVEGGNMDASGYVMAGGTSGGSALIASTSGWPTSGSAGGAEFWGRPRIGDFGNWLTIGEIAGTNGGMTMQITGTQIYTGISASVTTMPATITLHNTLDNGSGYVGILTTSPAEPLEVNGEVRVDNLAGTNYRPVYADASGDLVVNSSLPANTSGGSQTFSYSGSIVTFTVPNVYAITITCKGAQGGSNGGTGGVGAIMVGTFTGLAGQTLSILVGQQPSGGSFAGGGGGSFVALGASYTTAVPLIVAGGGGGSTSGTGGAASTGTSGLGNVPGTNGQGAASTTCAGGGGGFYSSGGNDTEYGYGGGQGFRQGGAGGTTSGEESGGFGGGAAPDYVGACNQEGGSGGGYSGGSGYNSTGYLTTGWGGGSYNAGYNQSNTTGNTGNGSVTITW